jgi:hypothetical protein
VLNWLRNFTTTYKNISAPYGTSALTNAHYSAGINFISGISWL